MTSKSDFQLPFVRDYGVLLVEKARAALLAKAKKKKESSDAGYEIGELMGLYAAVSLLEQQAMAFGLSKEDVGLAGFSADELLRE